MSLHSSCPAVTSDIEPDIQIFERYGWSLVFHIPDLISLPRASHSHQDYLSPLLYYQNKPVTIDPGRYDYTTSTANLAISHGQLCFKQNTVPFPSERDTSLIRPSHKSFRLTTTIGHDHATFSFTYIPPFRCFHRVVSIARRISLWPDRVIISDRIRSRRPYTFFYQMYFSDYFSTSMQCRLRISSPHIERMFFPGTLPLVRTASSYGAYISTHRLVHEVPSCKSVFSQLTIKPL